MFEQYEHIVNQYNIQVNNFYKGRGAILMETNLGLKLLKEVQLHQDKLGFLDTLQEKLCDSGFFVDSMLRTKDGELFAQEDNKKYVIKNWTEGREIYFNDKNEVTLGIKHLARMHLMDQHRMPNHYEKFDRTKLFIDTLTRHNQELVRIRNGIRKMGNWSDFDLLFLASFDRYYNEGQKALKRITKIYSDVANRYDKDKVVIHGQYNHHNLIFDEKKQLHIMNFECASYHLPIMDLYSMLRKTLEKNDWDIKLGLDMIDVYMGVFELTPKELEIITYLFLYPEKFWKICNYYFNLNKAWKPKQTWVKLKKLVAQEEKKHNFIESLRNYITSE